ncbi:choice-of-anchor D domain-containing protein, partial [bacterium]
LSITSMNIYSQEKPIFNITGVDASGFPLVKSYFIAKNGNLNEDYYKAPQDIANPSEFSLSENGISKDITSLKLKCQEIKGELPIHIALVVDASTSMFLPWNGETRADILKRAVNEFIDSVKFVNGTSMHIVPFAGNKIDASVWKDWNYTAQDAKEDFKFYRELQGRTDFNTPMFKEPNGRNVLEIFKSRPINERKAVVFLTDGAHDNTNGNNPFMKDFIIEELQKRGIEFYSITFAADDYASVNDLQQISHATGGVYFNAYSEEDLRDTYKQITDGFKSTSVCWLEWLSQLECEKATERNVEATFTRTKYSPIVRDFTYTPPADKAVAEITRDKDVLYFDNNGKTTQNITVKAVTGDFQVTGYNITNNNGDFDIPEFASVPPQGFLIKQGKSKTFAVNYIKNPSDVPVDFELTFETDLCPVAPVQLIAPCGPTTLPIDFGTVNLAGSTDYLAQNVFTNTSKGELSGTLNINGADASEFTIKSVNGKAGNTFKLASGEQMDVELTITPSTTGVKNAELNYGITTDCGQAISTIKANVIEADLNLASHNWGLVRIGNPIKYSYTIENTNDDNVEIESISLSDNNSGFTLGDISGSIGVVKSQGGKTSFDITYQPITEGSSSIDLQVKLKNRVELLTAKLSGIGFVPKIKGNNLTFPATKIGDYATPQNLVIENTSEYGEMEISNIYLKAGSDAAFTIDLSSYTIGTKISKGQQLLIPINFNPTTTIGPKNGTIIVEADNTEGVEPVTFVLNEFKITGEAIPGDAVTLPTTDVGPILSCELKEFSINLKNETNLPVTVNATLNQNTDFNVISKSFVIPANSTYDAKIEYLPSGVGIHLASIDFNYSDGLKYIAPLKGTATNENADLIKFDKTLYSSLVGTTLKTHFDINLAKYNIRPDVAVNQLKLTIGYNGRMLNMTSDDISTNVGLAPIVDLTNQVSNNSVTLTFNGNIPLRKNLLFDIPYLVTLGNDTTTTMTVDADFAGLSCLTIETGTIQSITKGCGIGVTLLSDINFVDKGFAAELIGQNPVNDKLGIRYELPYDNNINIEVYNNSGKMIETIKNGTGKFGITEEYLDVSNLTSGIYMLRFVSGPFVKNTTFMKIK